MSVSSGHGSATEKANDAPIVLDHGPSGSSGERLRRRGVRRVHRGPRRRSWSRCGCGWFGGGVDLGSRRAPRRPWRDRGRHIAPGGLRGVPGLARIVRRCLRSLRHRGDDDAFLVRFGRIDWTRAERLCARAAGLHDGHGRGVLRDEPLLRVYRTIRRPDPDAVAAFPLAAL